MNTPAAKPRGIHQIKPKYVRGAMLMASLFAAATLSFAQAVPETTQPTPADDEVVELSRFTVTGAKDSDGYRATDSLAGTRLRTELKDIASAVSVVTGKFLQDTGSVKAEDLLVYTPNTEVGGSGGNYLGAGGGASLNTSAARIAPQSNTRVRGLAPADNTRDFFITSIPWDSYNVDRVDLQRGPNSILFGLGSPAGIINTSINAAAFKDKNVIEGRFGSYASMRASADFNKVLLRDELAVRASLLYDHTKYQQQPAFNKDERYYAALRYDPKFLRFEGARTTFRANYEHGNVSANRPRNLAPADMITPWFTQLNKRTYNPTTVGLSNPALIDALVAAGDLGAGSAQTTLDGGISNIKSPTNPKGTYEPWVYFLGEISQQLVAVFPNPNNGTQSGIISGRPDISGALGPTGATDNIFYGITGDSALRGLRGYDEYAKLAGLPNAGMGVYKAKSLTDSSIFDFYNNLLEGPNKREWQNFEAANMVLAQSFFNERLGIEGVYDWQKYDEGTDDILAGWAQAVAIDLNSHLTDGTPNPNVGRPVLVGNNYGNSSSSVERTSWRFTAYGELNFKDFMDDKSWVTRLLGRHVFTGLYSTTSNERSTRSWARYSTDDAYGARIGVSNFASPQRLLATINYLGPSLLNASSASGANIGNLKAVQNPTSSTARFFNSTWNAPASVGFGDLWTTPAGGTSTQSENPANYVGWTNIPVGIRNSQLGGIDNLYYNGSLSRDDVKSKALVWQGFFWDGTIVPMASWREDHIQSYTTATPEINAIIRSNNSLDFNSPRWRLPGTPKNDETVNSSSWSIVVHTPKWIADKMPARTNVSLFYNRSSNFQPVGYRVDVNGTTLTSPSGKTKDYGIVINTLNDRLTLKLNWYETTNINTTLDALGGAWYIGTDVAWNYMFAMQAKNKVGGFAAPYTPAPGQTAEQALAAQNAAVTAFLANMPSKQFLDAWQITDQDLNTDWQWWIDGAAPAAFNVSGDTMSKGVEIELTAQPLKNWNITFNLVKTSAKRQNLGGSLADYIEARHALYEGPAGDVRLWGPEYGGETARSKFDVNLWSPYRLFTLQEGSDVPELRPWRFNLVTSYSFDQGRMKGFNVGAGYRWQDKIIVGYPIKNDDYDLSNPYYGPTEDAIDFWAGYQRKLGRKVTWRIQLNVRNLFEKAHLVPVTVQPDGSPAAMRIAEGMVWSITNRFEF